LEVSYGNPTGNQGKLITFSILISELGN